MGRVIEDYYDEDDIEYNEPVSSHEPEYPRQFVVDGYNINHYHDGDIPVYEILDDDGNVMDVAHSRDEIHEITSNESSE